MSVSPGSTSFLFGRPSLDWLPLPEPAAQRENTSACRPGADKCQFVLQPAPSEIALAKSS